MPSQQQQEQSAFNFFERQQSDRKKRTFEILSQFNPALATEVVYKEHQMRLGGGSVSEFELGGVVGRNYYQSGSENVVDNFKVRAALII